jgi:hypothetical protein
VGMLSGWVVATLRSPRNVAHAHLSIRSRDHHLVCGHNRNMISYDSYNNDTLRLWYACGVPVLSETGVHKCWAPGRPSD